MPWVPADSKEPKDLEEEERRERMTGLLDCNAARKRKRQVISSSKSLSMVSPSLTKVRGTRPSSFSTLPNKS